MIKKIDKNKNGRLCAAEMSEAFKTWLGFTLTPEDVDGIFNTIQPKALENDEIELMVASSDFSMKIIQVLCEKSLVASIALLP